MSASENPDAAAPAASPTPIYELVDVDKRFTGTHALKSVSVTFNRGEVHAIVGENGAGKSTLIKILTGVYTPTGGTIRFDGKPVHIQNPADALALGIDAVHQEVVLCPHLSVAANMFLGREETTGGLLAERKMRRESQRVLDELGFEIDAKMTLGDLSIGRQQLVAAARAAMRDCRFLIFDEPTAYLTRRETDELFELIRRLHRQGVTLVYISHRLEEVFELADRVTVLRDGALISTRNISEIDHDQVIRDMVARSIEEVHVKEEVARGDPLLVTKGLTGPGFNDISITVHRGEIVGLYGLIGAGRSEFVQSVFGRRPATSGTIELDGKPIVIRKETDAINAGIALVPEGRRDQGLCLNLPVGQNVNLTVYGLISRLGLVRGGEEARRSQAQIQSMSIRTPGPGEQVMNLSGGNQQKVVVGKWLNHGADLFIFDEPTVGVDIATKVEIYRLFTKLLRDGAGIILISSYLPEVYDLADVLHVFREGHLVATHDLARGERESPDASHERVLAQAIGA